MRIIVATLLLAWSCGAWAADDPPSPGGYGGQAFPKPYSAPCTERENVFEFTEKPGVKTLGNDRYEITFAVKGNCDVTIGIVDEKGIVVRHLGSGVLGANAPAPFQKNSLKQTIYWNGKDDLDVYHREPGKLKVRVMLGLKPEFDKRLGGTSPKNTPGGVWGLAADPDGVYVISLGRRFYVRKFDHDGNYVQSLVPPSASLPESKLTGMGYVEYEAGRRDPHARDVYTSTANIGNYLSYDGYMINHLQPVASKGKLFYLNNGGTSAFVLYHIGTDGSTDRQGCFGRPFIPGFDLGGRSGFGHLATSPDGNWIYFTDSGTSSCIWRCATDGDKPAESFVAGKIEGAGGKKRSMPGNGAGEFNCPQGIDCDGQGRLYVCDKANMRVQVFSPEGKFLKEIRMDRPALVQVHKKTGAIYVHHTVRVEGQSVARVSKLSSFENPVVEAYFDCPAESMALDSWAQAPRVWLARGGRGVSAWEDGGKSFKKIVDFDEEAKKEAGANYFGRWPGWHSNIEKVAADPVREQVYYCNRSVFDIRTGAFLRDVSLNAPDDVAFDKKGYMHLHFRPPMGVGRVDPGQGYREVPYDYGVEANKWRGILPCRDQEGAKSFQDGVGVNMMGEVAENCNIYYAPKMDDDSKVFAMAGEKDMQVFGSFDDDGNNYKSFVAGIAEKQRRGEEVYSIRRQPGVPLIGATIWTFSQNGELKDECAVTVGGLVNGVQIDEGGYVYFVNNRPRLIGNGSFLAGRGGIFGAPDYKRNNDPFTGTLVKVKSKARVLSSGAAVRMDEASNRPPEFGQSGEKAWVDGAEWFYAGASPIVAGGCSCPTMRIQTDWYKRTFVPEVYRHSVGVLDSAGNLILHVGRYGNLDSGDGPKSRIPVGGDGIGMTFVNVVAATDNYLCFPDHGERLVVLKLNYHAEESVGIGK